VRCNPGLRLRRGTEMHTACRDGLEDLVLSYPDDLVLGYI
jgi:hypothetical protein